MYCIYQITNTLNGKRYIGQHKYTNSSNPMGYYKGSGKILRLAYSKYGMENFETEILYNRIRDKDTVDAIEVWAIEKYKPEYNIAKGGTGGDTGTHHHSNKGLHWYNNGIENIMSEECPIGFTKGRCPLPKHTEEQKNKISEGMKKSEKYKESRKSEKLRKYLVEQQKGKKLSEETKRKISEVNKGKKLSEETKNKIAKSVKEYWRVKKWEVW